jgi:YebC/PmpR family DNA-binding regulatory protein
MSGHSKWATIKRKKGALDDARSKVFQKLAREIYVFAKKGDKDPKNNPNLRMVIEKARGENMPNDKIQKAIDKAHGGNNGEDYESIRYEGYGPAGIAIMVDALTDNKNRTASAVRSTFTRHNGNLGSDGSVNYLFERKGIIVIPNTYDEDSVMMNVLDNGALDFKVYDDTYEIITDVENFIKVKEGLTNFGVNEFIVSEISFIPNVEVEVTEAEKEKVQSLVDALDDLDDTQNVYNNMKE